MLQHSRHVTPMQIGFSAEKDIDFFGFYWWSGAKIPKSCVKTTGEYMYTSLVVTHRNITYTRVLKCPSVYGFSFAYRQIEQYTLNVKYALMWFFYDSNSLTSKGTLRDPLKHPLRRICNRFPGVRYAMTLTESYPRLVEFVDFFAGCEEQFNRIQWSLKVHGIGNNVIQWKLLNWLHRK